jgi:phosphoglycolate phosphatase
MTYKGVVFDLDGTLADSLDDIADSMNRVLVANHFPTHKRETYRGFIGNGVKNLVFQSIPEENREETIVARCFDMMLEDYEENCMVKTKLYNGIHELLDHLHERGLKLAVFSNKTDELTQKIARKLLNDWNMEVVLGAGGDIPRKPDPKGVLLICQKLGLAPDELIYMGDTGIDMQTATAAGMHGVGVLWGFRDEEELLLNGAKLILKHPMDLVAQL